MSKRRKTKVFSFQGFDLAHYKATEAYTRAVSALFDKATDDIANAASRENYNPDNPFSFDDYPKAKAQLQKTIKGLAGKMQAVIETASRKQWLFACQKNDEFIASIFDTTKLTKGQLKKYQDRNLDALQAFQQRKVGGMDLSERVWKYTQQYKEQIEAGLDVGLGEGRSAQQLSRDLRQNLKDPNRLFRRVRDKRGNLQLSKSAKAFHPGQGVYRSSYKNAMRLTRSEINMSYRESDHLRWQQLDFVLGFEVHRSNREPKCNCELCERLVGRYPKWFKFKGWHPQCLCYAIPILEDFYSKERSDDRVARMRAALRGEEYKKYVSKALIKDLPDNFKEWASENEERQKNWASTPYFIKDNFVDGDLSKGLMYIQKQKPLTIQERAAIRHKQRTPEEVQDILKRWEERKQKQAIVPSELDSVIEALNDARVEYNDVRPFTIQLSEEEIISRVGGGDLTRGSCSSLAFAYAGNRGGLDVLDFRDGNSRAQFSTRSVISNVVTKVGGIVVEEVSDFRAADSLFSSMIHGREYYFACAAHAAIVRKSTSGYEYLELQSATDNGFKPLTKDVLKWRFGAKQSRSSRGRKIALSSFLVDIDNLNNNSGFRRMLGYINTNEGDQKKGGDGTIR